MNHELRHWARAEPDRPAVCLGDTTLGYAQLEAQANQLGRVFAAAGLARGEHVAMLLPNVPMVFVAAWAALRSGLYLTPVSTALSAAEVTGIVRDCQATMLIADAAFAAVVGNARDSVDSCRHWLCSGGAIDGFASLEATLSRQPPTPRDGESPGALMYYTSGTTGSPRGVWRPLLDPSHRGPPPGALELTSLFGLRQGMRYLSPAPLYHAGPLQFSIAATTLGGTVFAMDKFDAATALQLLVRHRITHSQWVPTMFQRMLQLPQELRDAFSAPDHEIAIHAAAPCPPSVKRAMIDWWGPILLEYYGGSEGVGNTRIDSADWLAHPGSVGRAVKGRLHVVGDDGAELSPGTSGRVYFSGTTPFEYFGDPAKTASRRHPLGWQTLGEIGHVDADGYLVLTDRQDDMVISGGVNVYPQEIESAILELPQVGDCGVVGIADARFGERPVAFITAAPGHDRQALAAAVQAHCERRLGRIKRPDRIVVVDDLPRSATGKLLRRALRQLLTSEELR